MTIRRKPARSITAVALAGLVMAFGTLGGAERARAAPDTVKFGMPIPVTLTDNGFHAFGEELGLFKDENLDLKITRFKGSGKLVPQIATKNIDVGWAMPGALYSSYQPGRDRLDVVYFYNPLPVWSIMVAVLADSDIKSYADLKGKKVGVGALTWGTIPVLKAEIMDAGLEPGKDVKIVAVGILGSGFQALKTGRVDGLDYNHTWHDMLELSGTKLRRLELKPKFAGLFGNGMMANREVLVEKRDLLTRFARAMAASSIACQENLEACVKAFWRRYPNMKPKGDEAKALANSVMMLRNRLEVMQIPAKNAVGKLGYWPREAFQYYLDAYYDSGWVSTRDIEIEKMYTNDLIADINKIDEAKVRARARAAK